MHLRDYVGQRYHLAWYHATWQSCSFYIARCYSLPMTTMFQCAMHHSVSTIHSSLCVQQMGCPCGILCTIIHAIYMIIYYYWAVQGECVQHTQCKWHMNEVHCCYNHTHRHCTLATLHYAMQGNFPNEWRMHYCTEIKYKKPALQQMLQSGNLRCMTNINSNGKW